MKLKLENGRSILNPTVSQIEEALKTVENKENNYLIFERDEKQFMQVALDLLNGFYIEYHNGREEKHFKSTNEFNSFELTLDTLINYSRRNNRWHSIHTWEKLSNITPSANKLISLSTIFMLLGISIIIGIVFFDELIESTFDFSLNGKHFYILTLAISLTLPGFWEDFKQWESLELLSKTYAISAFFTFFIMLLLSICTFFGIGNC